MSWQRWNDWLLVTALAPGAWIEARGRIGPLASLENHDRELPGQSAQREGLGT